MDFIRFLVHNKLLNFIKNWDLINLLFGALDIFAIALAFQCSYYLNFYEIGGLFINEKKFLILFVAILPFWLIILYLLKNAEIPRTKRYRVMFFKYLQSAVIMYIILIISFLIFRINAGSSLFQIELILFGFLFLFAFRVLEYKVFKIYRAKGYNQVNLVLITDDSSQPFIESLLVHKEWGYRIIAIFTGSLLLYEKYEKSIILLKEENLAVLNDLIEGNIVDEVLYLKRKVDPLEVRKVVSSCEELGVTFKLRYDNKINLTNALKTNIANTTFLNFINIPNKEYSLAFKKILDFNISFLMLIILSPILLIISGLVKITSAGPVIYRQSRVGLRGRKFNLYKFRTMVNNAEILRKGLDAENEVDGPVFKIKNDPRVTKIGTFLRKTGLDELPQLLNIMKGEMSLIGPRPPLESETQQYKRWQLRRLSVKPGLSCFWQIKPDRNNIKFEKWMELDLAYIDNWSLRLDFMIFLKTIKTVFLRSGQ
ncbi:MAG: exopolysaccharide biosynthesis polyprenyl glycosylphosphotransferase [Ignavibacteriales bacterium]|nr:MAG: exopolysaccharide biosynthesis polyprenyl glycosylphosphotransferase [Ignavibacteriales bacterium]